MAKFHCSLGSRNASPAGPRSFRAHLGAQSTKSSPLSSPRAARQGYEIFHGTDVPFPHLGSLAKGGFVQPNNPMAPQLTAAGINIPNIADSPEQAPLKIPAIAGNLFYKQPKWAAKSWEHCKLNLELASSLLDYLHSLRSRTFASQFFLFSIFAASLLP